MSHFLKRLELNGFKSFAGKTVLEFPAGIVAIVGPNGSGKSNIVDALRWLLGERDAKNLRGAKVEDLIFAGTQKRARVGMATASLHFENRNKFFPVDFEEVAITRQISRGGESKYFLNKSEVLLRDLVDFFAKARMGSRGLIIIGQGDSDLADLAELSVYVMTSEFGAGTQLEKINMLDFARLVVINKFEDKRAEDALAAVRRQVRRNRGIPPAVPDAELPVYGTAAARFNDPGVDKLYLDLLAALRERDGGAWRSRLPDPGPAAFSCERGAPIVPSGRVRYLQEIVQAVRDYKQRTAALAGRADRLQALETAAAEFEPLRLPAAQARQELGPEGAALLEQWDRLQQDYAGETFSYRVRGQDHAQPLSTQSLSGTRIRKVELPATDRLGAIVRFLRQENVPGRFPFTAGAWTFRRADEDPKRQFAGEGGPERTNRRFHYLCRGESARRLSTAFDSVTLYGQDPDERPDIYGKIGESGVSIATLDDMKQLFAGFDLADPATSVSMTINGPAPVILAMYLEAAVDQQLERQAATPGTAARIRAETLRQLRGTVQADILKEDQAQNTCIFSIEFALRMMGDVQAFLIANGMRNYYSVSVSGYHIAEAGANPISQLAFTLANGFTFVEYYLSRGMHIDDFAPNLSFFFSNGLDPEYSVIGRVARRIWALAMKEKYGANERSQKLKYHIQTSGRSLHAQEIDFNDIRTTLQALYAIYDNCNSLHTNAYDEAITTPTEASVRRAIAVQLIINRELGQANNENPLQGSFFIEQMTELVEEAVLMEFRRISDRGGVLGAMETMYQRGKIQEESMHYEHLKHSGELPIIGVNTFLNPQAAEPGTPELIRSTEAEKQQQIVNLEAFQARNADKAPTALDRLKEVARSDGNLFDALLDAAKVCSLGQISQALYEVGGQYRRNM